MNQHNFNHWVAKRNNEINEGWFDWLWTRKGQTPPTDEPKPTDPTDIQRDIYNNTTVKQYVDIVLDHMGLQPGAVLQQINPKTNTPIGTITITDMATQNPNFYRSLQRFIAGHVIGGGTAKTYLRISQHDAVSILRTLDQYHKQGSDQSILDELGINKQLDLADWMQTKLPTARDAVKQQGYDSTSFNKRSSPLNNSNTVNSLIKASSEVVRQGLGRKSSTVGLRQALIDLNNELSKIGNNVEPIPVRKHEPKKAPGVDNPIVGGAGAIS